MAPITDSVYRILYKHGTQIVVRGDTEFKSNTFAVFAQEVGLLALCVYTCIHIYIRYRYLL